jgi:hypothetical protein
MNMNIHSNEEVSGMAVIFGTAGAPPLFALWILDVKNQ